MLEFRIKENLAAPRSKLADDSSAFTRFGLRCLPRLPPTGVHMIEFAVTQESPGLLPFSPFLSYNSPPFGTKPKCRPAVPGCILHLANFHSEIWIEFTLKP